MGMDIHSELAKSYMDAIQLDDMEEELSPEESAFDFSDYEKFTNPANARPKKEEQVAKTPIGKPDEIQESEFADFEEDFGYRKITDEDIESNASRFYPEEKTYRSLLLEVFTEDQCIELEKIQRTYSISNNQKIQMYREKLDSWKIHYAPIGGGTNRYAFMTDSYIVKIACDADGKIDNKREYIYSIALQPYVIKCYEAFEDGFMAIFEYVECFTMDDFWKNTRKMKEILSHIGNQFLIGDVGVSSKNYVNWGFRDDQTIVILDYAYIYSVKFKQFTCNCSPNAVLCYDNDFVDLICNTCGKKYTFRELRKKISRKDQDDEIGNLLEKGYVLHSKEEKKKFEPKFVLGAYGTIKNKLEKEMKKKGKIAFSSSINETHEVNEDEPESLEAVLAGIDSGYYDDSLQQYK